MTNSLIITLAQLNLYVGDIEGIATQVIAAANQARDEQKADVIVFPELTTTGYPPEDLLFRPAFLKAAEKSLRRIMDSIQNIYCIIGHPYQEKGKLYNACSVIYNSKLLGRYKKQILPNYSIFDEYRYFTPGTEACVVKIKDVPVGITICEDLWHEGPIQEAAKAGAHLIISPNASPYEIDKHDMRILTLQKRAQEVKLPIVYVNCIGGQDELVFDGGSMVINANGEIAQHAGLFNEILFPVQANMSAPSTFESLPITLPDTEEQVYQALVLGVRDYVEKNHFKGVLIGVSGGIDSALVLAIAVDALGKDKVEAIVMPSRYTADMSMEDGMEIIKRVGVKHQVISIEPAFQAYIETLDLNKNPGITEENLQSRCRGTIIMALSNQTGKMVLTTGNRSEMTVGYATLYGDMAGGLDVLKDIPKTLVYRLAEYRNQIESIIPERIITRPPSAELAPDQKDEDSLPPYPILDRILELYLNQEQSIDEIIAAGFEADVVKKVIMLIHKSEYKRRQAPIGIRVNHKAFGRDRRYPITSGFKN